MSTSFKNDTVEREWVKNEVKANQVSRFKKFQSANFLEAIKLRY